MQVLLLPTDTLAEWLRRRPAKPMGSPRVGSNPTGVVFYFLSPPQSVTYDYQYCLMLIILTTFVLTSRIISGLIAQLVRAYGQ